MYRPKPEDVIYSIRDSFKQSQTVYSYGSCYKLYQILKTIFPYAKPLINESKQHIVTSIGYKLYDIDGEVSQKESMKEKFSPMNCEEVEYFKDRRFNIQNPDMFIPDWFHEEEVYCQEYMERLADHMGYEIKKRD